MRKNDKGVEWICLVAWVLMCCYAIFLAFTNQTVNPVAFIAASVICILHYIEKILDI